MTEAASGASGGSGQTTRGGKAEGRTAEWLAVRRRRTLRVVRRAVVRRVAAAAER